MKVIDIRVNTSVKIRIGNKTGGFVTTQNAKIILFIHLFPYFQAKAHVCVTKFFIFYFVHAFSTLLIIFNRKCMAWISVTGITCFTQAYSHSIVIASHVNISQMNRSSELYYLQHQFRVFFPEFLGEYGNSSLQSASWGNCLVCLCSGMGCVL